MSVEAAVHLDALPLDEVRLEELAPQPPSSTYINTRLSSSPAVLALDQQSLTSDTDSLEEEDAGRPPERWAPLGADAPSPSPCRVPMASGANSEIDRRRLKELEDEQEQLNTSLMELTTHFAQVQFRLEQISQAPGEEKEVLLQELSEFASKGCPDLMGVRKTTELIKKEASIRRSVSSLSDQDAAIAERQLERQRQLIDQLRDQLQDLEKFAYETGNAELPSSEVMAKQRVIIDSLQSQLDLHVDDKLGALSEQDLQRHVDQAVKKLINPLKLKDQLVDQLKTQIDDLHRFVEFLQTAENQNCTCLEEQDGGKTLCRVHHKAIYGFGEDRPKRDGDHSGAGMLQTLYALQLFVLETMGCQSRNHFHKNTLKKSTKGNHWGDVRAVLELAIDACVDLCQTEPERRRMAAQRRELEEEDDAGSVVDLDDADECPRGGTSDELLFCVRKQLCPALRDVLQHGMLPNRSATTEIVGTSFGCIPKRSMEHYRDTDVHVWDVILKYYDMKNGKEFNDLPLRKLSQSFNLNNVGGKNITSKQLLLTTIDSIITSHTKLKRSPDAHWKAFVSAGLNQKSLVSWLRMILRTREVIDENYAAWSYAARTGCDDALKSLERLGKFDFTLPVELATQAFKNMRDAF